MASVFCVQLAAKQLGLPAAGEGEKLLDDDAAKAIGFRLVATGQFVASFPRMRLQGSDRVIDLTCTGDFNRRLITSLQIDGTINRPVKAEDWTF